MRKARRKGSSMVVERDLQSKANDVNETDTHNSADCLPDEKDLDLPAWEQSMISPTKFSQDYYLSGLSMQDPASPPNDRVQAAPKESAEAIDGTLDSLVAAGRSEKRTPISGPSPMDKYLSDNSEKRYAVFILKSSDRVQWSQHTDYEGRSHR